MGGINNEGLKLKPKKEIEEKEVRNNFLLEKVSWGLRKKMVFLSRKGGFVGGFEEDEKIVDMAIIIFKQEWRHTWHFVCKSR